MASFEDYLALRDAANPPPAPVDAPPAPAQPQVGYGEDIAKGFAGGVGRGTSGLLGLPGDVAEYGARGIDWVAKKLGAEPRAPQAPTYGSADIQKGIEGYTGKFYEPQTMPGQFASTIGEFAPASILPGSGGVSTAKQIGAKAFNTVFPAITSETAGQVTKGTAAEPWARGIAGVLGGVVGGKLITPAAPASQARQDAAAVMDRYNIPISAGDRTGSKPLQWAEATAADMPGSAGRAAEMRANTRGAYDKAITEHLYDRGELTARGVPEHVNLPDPQVAAVGPQSLSDEYTRLTQANELKSNAAMQNRMTAAQSEYERKVLPSQRASAVEDIRNDITDKLVAGGGKMSGDEYQSIRSQIGTSAKNATNPAEARALREFKQSLDDAMQAGLSPADAEAWLKNNQRWSNMKQLEPAVASSIENLSPARVAQTARAGRNAQYAAQKGDMDELTRAAGLVLKDLPQTGTTARAGWQQLFNLPNALSAGGGYLGSHFGPLGTAAGVAAPFAAARAVVSKPGQAYLGNQLLPQRSRDIIAQTLAEQAISQGDNKRLRITVNPRRGN